MMTGLRHAPGPARRIDAGVAKLLDFAQRNALPHLTRPASIAGAHETRRLVSAGSTTAR